MHLRHNKIYWANPDNTFHDVYQMAINRRFCFTVTLLSLLRAVSIYGIGQTFFFIIVTVVSCAFLAVILSAAFYVLEFLFNLIEYTINYLNGE